MSEPFSDKKEPNGSTDMKDVRIAKIKCKTDMRSHVSYYQFLDDKDELIGKPLGTKYEEIDTKEFILEIPKDEVLIGFKIEKHSGDDNKIGNIAFKTIKHLTNDKLQEYEKGAKKDFKWQYEFWEQHKLV